MVDSAEATIEDDQSTRYYMTLQQAVDAAEDDETVVVVKDLSASGAEYLVTLDDESKTVTVDLNGKTLLYTGSGTGDNPQNGEAISVSAGKLVLKNGTVNMVNDEAGGSVYWGIRVHGTGSLAMSKVTVTSEDSPLFMSNVSADGRIYLTLDECYIEGVYSAVYMNGSTSPAEITINNSTIVSKDVGIYVSNSVNTGNRQKLTITDSTVTGTTAIEVKHTDATITGCTLISTAAEQKSQINGNGSCIGRLCLCRGGQQRVRQDDGHGCCVGLQVLQRQAVLNRRRRKWILFRFHNGGRRVCHGWTARRRTKLPFTAHTRRAFQTHGSIPLKTPSNTPKQTAKRLFCLKTSR